MALDPFHHVVDHYQFDLLETVPTPLSLPYLFGHQVTKFMVLELIAAGLILAIYVPLARRIADGSPPRGPFDNLFEVFLTFVRDEVARPTIGDHEADRYVPFLWTMFLFVLFNNLLGMIPFLGSPTGTLSVTGGLALCAFVVIHAIPIMRDGPIHYLKTFIPPLDLGESVGMKLFALGISAFMFVIELAGAFIRAIVLAVRLFANMLAGHTALAVILGFIVLAHEARAGLFLTGTITIASVTASVAFSLLELFVAFLQAYIFTFLTSLFIGMALHPEH
jgi:F-type H+-transporting ATPase subunit a